MYKEIHTFPKGISPKVNVIAQLEFELAISGTLFKRKGSSVLHDILRIQQFRRGGPRGVMVKAMDCGIVVSKFILQSRYNVHFRANTLGKGMNPLILPAMGYIAPQLFF